MINKILLLPVFLLTSCQGQVIPNQPLSNYVINEKELKFIDNTLYAPEFKLVYQAHLQDAKAIQTFLKTMYQFIKKEVFYSNEIYTLDEIVFRKNENNLQATGFYLFDQQKIYIEASNNASLENIKLALLQQYYYHLTTSYFFDLQPLKHEFSDSLFLKYFEFSGVKKNILSLLTIQREFVYPKSVAYQVDKEIKHLLNDKNFIKNNPIDFPNVDLSFFNQDYWEKNIANLSKTQDLMVQSLILQTAIFKDVKNSKRIVKDFNVWRDYFMHLVLKINPYFKYVANREWIDPYYFWDNEEEAKKNNEIFIETPFLKDEKEINQQFWQFKDYFVKEVFNIDQQKLTSALIKKNSDLSYSLVLNLKNQDDKIELIAQDGKKADYQIIALKSQSNHSYNLLPFNPDKKGYFKSQTFPYEIKDLKQGEYVIKINGQDVKQALNLQKYHNNSLILYGTNWNANKNNSLRYFGKYIFKIKGEKLVLSVN